MLKEAAFQVTVMHFDIDCVECIWCNFIMPLLSGSLQKIDSSASKHVSYRVRDFLQLLGNCYSAEWVSSSKNLSKSKRLKAPSSSNDLKKDIFYEYDIPRIKSKTVGPTDFEGEVNEEGFEKNTNDAVDDAEDEDECLESSLLSSQEDANIVEGILVNASELNALLPGYMQGINENSFNSYKNLLIHLLYNSAESMLQILTRGEENYPTNQARLIWKRRLPKLLVAYPSYRQLIGMLVEQKRSSIDPSATQMLELLLNDDVVQLAHSAITPLDRALVASLLSIYTRNCIEDQRKDHLVSLRDYPPLNVMIAQKELLYRKFIRFKRKTGSYRVKVIAKASRNSFHFVCRALSLLHASQTLSWMHMQRLS